MLKNFSRLLREFTPAHVNYPYFWGTAMGAYRFNNEADNGTGTGAARAAAEETRRAETTSTTEGEGRVPCRTADTAFSESEMLDGANTETDTFFTTYRGDRHR